MATGSYTFDEFDRLIEMTVDGDRHRYRYAQGLRVSDRDVSEQSTTVFRWDVSGAVSRLLEDGEHAYIYGLGTSPVAQVDIATGDIEYLHGDLVGSTRIVSDASGDVVSSFEYSAYGEISASTGDAGATQYLFAGEYRDPTGLYYLRARYLDTRIGQFLSLDPMGTVTGMPYAYTAGDPFMQTDPLGLFSIGPVNVSDWFSGAAEAGKRRLDGLSQQYNPWMWDDMWRALKCGAESQGGGFGGWFTQLNVQANPLYAYFNGAYMYRQGVADGNWYDAGYGGTNAAMGLADTALIAAGGVGAVRAVSAFKTTGATATSTTVATNSRTAITLAASDLNAAQSANFARYIKKLPASAQTTVIAVGDSGTVTFTTKVPGKVPGSYAVYMKTVDEAGVTIGYIKTTVAPDGSIASIKDKLAGE